ncbi:MAG: PAS domain-containing protein [SAR324 cluster bacterium]|nr:PAS domain-containing protein [SAR324 cluster bacterium]
MDKQATPPETEGFPAAPDQIKENTLSHYVGIGASAGGLEAIEEFFKNMPTNSGLGFIVIQHLSPDYKSLMVELLSKRTEMPVYRAEEGMVVQENSIYLIPPKKNLRIFHGKLLLSEQDYTKGLNLPIDVFLRSLAEDQGEKSIGIILSGTGSDGMRGIRAIKELGGMVMVQSEESAKFDGMPRSAISTGLADYVIPPAEMPTQLLSFLQHPYASKTDLTERLFTSEDNLTRIYALLREKHKVDFTYYKPSTIVRRIERRMTVNQIHELRDYVKYMESYQKEVSTLYRELLIGVTNFFRDPEAFETLRTQFLPKLLDKKAGEEVRIWVAGCSSGEEAYTLAILSKECIDALGKSCTVKVFATDVDREAIVKAGTGIYPGSIAADMSPELLAKYFYHKEDDFHIIRGIREMIVFAQHNIIKDPPFTNIDLVSCRNLMIYLQPILQRKVLENFNFSLNPQGILMLGTSETTGDMTDYFEAVDHKWKFYRSKGKHKTTERISEDTKEFTSRARQEYTQFAGRKRVFTVHEEERIAERMLQAVANHNKSLTMIVNEQMELLHILGDPGNYLKFSPGKTYNDISKIAIKELSIPLTTGIQRVFNKREEMRYSSIRLKRENAVITIQIQIQILPELRANQETLAIIFIEELLAEQRDEQQQQPGISYDLNKEAEQRIYDLEQELEFTRENLQATIEELETSNEELQSSNEELLASNEELQSTNEELQSVNEELYTVNSEYQGKIMELTELNHDIENLNTSTQIGTLFLDENLEIRRFTPETTKIFKILEGDIGRPFHYISHVLLDVNLLEVVQAVQRSSDSQEKEVQTEEGEWYMMRVLPYHVAPGVFSGVLLSFIYINQLKLSEQALQASEERYALAQEAAQIGSWDWNILTGELEWSEMIEPMFGFEKGNFAGTQNAFLECVYPEDRQTVLDAIDASIKEGDDYDVEHRIVWPDGTLHWIAQAGKVYHQDGQAVRMLGIVRDITKHKSMES